MSNKRKAVPITRSQKKAKTRSTLWKLQPKPEPTFDSFWTMLRGNEGMQESFYSGLRDPISFTLKDGDWVARALTDRLYDIYQIDLRTFEETEIPYTFEDLYARSRLLKIPVLKRTTFIPGIHKFSVEFDQQTQLNVTANRTDIGGRVSAALDDCESKVLAPGVQVRQIRIRI